MDIRIATIQELENWWDKKIEKQPNNPAYRQWKKTFVYGNKSGERKTFFVFGEKGEYIGQGTLLLKNNDPLMTGNGKAEIIKLEINKEHRGKGIATKIYEKIEDYAKQNGIHTLTIGVEPCEVRNMQIYFHWGFVEYLQCITETFPPREEGGVGETITVLCYQKKI